VNAIDFSRKSKQLEDEVTALTNNLRALERFEEKVRLVVMNLCTLYIPAHL